MTKATREDARRLMHDGALALSRVEEEGIRIDVDLLDRTIVKVRDRIDVLSARLKTSEEWREWRQVFGGKTSIGSRSQLMEMLRRRGTVVTEKTRTGKTKADKTVLERLDVPFVQDYLEVEKLKKLHHTYLLGVRREVVDGMLHSMYNLHLATTYRSSSDRPNFQNIPIRDKLVGKLIRRCFVPRDGHVLVEVDFKQLEVAIGSAYHRDPLMIEYLETGYDFHRALAAELYMLDEDQVSDEVRYCAKNRFVFPEFYGSYFVQAAPNLWEAIGQMDLRVKGTDVPLRDHLAERGIGQLGSQRSKWDRDSGGNTGWIDTDGGTFVDHVRNVEQQFWGERFKQYARWKNEWWNQYLRRGWFDLLTGFREEGVYKRNDAINHPIQGTAFHCLLWSLIQMVRWLVKNKMRSVIVGQIHDDMLADVHRSELDDFLAEVRDVTTRRLREHWDWIPVPLAVDVAVAEENWFEKRKIT